jgi:O-antigen/teichoic acid export membrane protein
LGLIKQQSIKGTIYSYAGVLLGFATVAILFPKYFTPAEIGAINLLISYSMILGQLGTLGFPSAIIRFFPKYRTGDGKHNGFVAIILIASLIGVVFFILGYLFLKPILLESNRESSPVFVKYFFLIIPLSLAHLLFYNLEAYANAIYKSAAGVFLKDFIQRILILIPLTAVIFELIEFNQYIYYYAAAIIITTFILIIYLISIRNFHIAIKPNNENRTNLGDFTSVSLYGLLVGFSALSLQRIDGILINEYYNEAFTGIYTTTFYFGTLVIIPSRVINRISYTVVSDGITQNDLKKVKDVYEKTSIIQLIAGTLLVAGLISNLDNIFRILPAEYIAGKWVVIWIALSNLVRMSGGAVDGIIAYSKYYRYNSLLIGVLLVSTIGFIVILIKDYGLNGVAFATFSGVVIFNIIRIIFVYRKFGMMPYKLSHAIILLFGVAAGGLAYIIPENENLMLDIAIRGSVLVLIFAFLIYISKVSKDTNKLILQGFAILKGKAKNEIK